MVISCSIAEVATVELLIGEVVSLYPVVVVSVDVAVVSMPVVVVAGSVVVVSTYGLTVMTFGSPAVPKYALLSPSEAEI